MSRTSRYITENDIIQKTAVSWKAGIYIRLSKEDEEKKDSSQSVISQRQIIDKFLSEHKDIHVVDYFIDDGYTGTTMDRPDFQRMKEAFERGDINCIVIKDLSRFARNDEESGRYIYVIFPFYKIRFISVNDKVDSFENPDSIYNLEIPFKNIMHSEYSRDLSKKVRSASDIRRRRGEFIGAFCTYGYKKDPDNFHHLIIDEEAAEIVRFIFKRYLETENFLRIAKELSEMNILTPLAYKNSKSINIKIPQKQICNTIWNDSAIKRILENETYLGHLIQGKSQTISYKNKKKIEKDVSQWVRVENTHVPIIPQEVFNEVQTLIAKNKRTTIIRTHKKHLFSGKLFCGECGASLSLGGSNTTKFKYYYCNNAYLKKESCQPKRTRNDKLEKVVLDTINSQLQVCLDSVKLLNSIGKRIQQSSKKNNRLIEQKQTIIKQLQRDKSELYSKYKEGHLTKEEYLSEKDVTERKIIELEKIIESLSFDAPNELDINNQPILSEFIKYRKFTKLTSEILDKFIERIIIFTPTEIEIHFKFVDEFKCIQNFIQDTLNKKVV